MHVENDKPSTCLNEALTDLSSTPYKFRKEDILAFFFNKFERLYDVFINQGIYMPIQCLPHDKTLSHTCMNLELLLQSNLTNALEMVLNYENLSNEHRLPKEFETVHLSLLFSLFSEHVVMNIILLTPFSIRFCAC